MERFNANVLISPSGKMYKTSFFGHLELLMEKTDYKNKVNWEDNIAPSVWKDKMIYEKKWIIVSGPQWYIHTNYQVFCDKRPTKASLGALYDLADEAHRFGDMKTYKQLYEVYRSYVD
jgi:hypothetical protein